MTAIIPNGQVDRLATGGSAGEDHARMHGRTLGVWENVKAYGATGDGVTDDTTAIQAAITAAETSSAGSPIYFPAGTYIISNPLNLTKSGQVLLGAGPSFASPTYGVVIKAAAASGLDYMIRLGGQRPTVSGITLHGNSTAKVGWLIHNARGGHLKELAASFCTEYGFEWNNIPPTFAAGNNNGMMMSKCHAVSNTGKGFGMRLYNDDNNAMGIFHCTATSNTSHGFELRGQGITMTGGHSESNGGYGIVLAGAGDSTATTGVHLYHPWLEGNTSGGVLMTNGLVSGCFYHRATQGTQGVDSSSDNRNWMFYWNTSGAFIQQRTGLEREIHFINNGITLSGGADTNRDMVLTPKGTGTVAIGQGARFTEISAPSAPAANNVILYAQDNGAGKTQLMALFSSGAAQQVAIQP